MKDEGGRSVLYRQFAPAWLDHHGSFFSWASDMRTPSVLPELGTGDEELRVSCWLVDLGDAVVAGDRIVEILFDGVTFDVTAEQTGRS